MRPTNAWWALIAAGGLGFLPIGCGRGGSEPAETPPAATEDTAEEAPPAAAPAPAAEAAAEAPAPAPPAPPAKKDATDEMLALAGGNDAPAGGPGGAAPGGAAPGGAAGGPQGASGPGGMPAGYPGAGGGGGNPQAAMKPGGMGGMPGMAGMGAGYPGAGGNPQAGMKPGMAGMPAGYPGAGGNPQAGMRPGGMAGMPGGMAGMPGGPGGGIDANKEPDFKSPQKGAESFLAALKSKDTAKLANATALRSVTEASAKHRDLFASIRDESITAEDLDELARAFDGMKITGQNVAKSSGSLGIIVGKSAKNAQLSRTIYMRHEKDGWKVRDFSELRELKNFRNMYGRKSSGGRRR